jgi:hypothetical protein
MVVAMFDRLATDSAEASISDTLCEIRISWVFE